MPRTLIQTLILTLFCLSLIPLKKYPEGIHNESGEKKKLITALNETLKAEFRLNPDTFIWGQDMANKDKGGIFNVSKGLQPNLVLKEYLMHQLPKTLLWEQQMVCLVTMIKSGLLSKVLSLPIISGRQWNSMSTRVTIIGVQTENLLQM